MTLNELDKWFRSFLKIEDFANDVSKNGIQIENSAPDAKQIKKIAFAVDACEETVQKAAAANADVLFVHHGLFWGGCETITGSFYKRVAPFLKNDIALYGCHIPLDANNPYGNNYGLAARINLKDLQSFGSWRGMEIGVKGILEKPLTVEQLAEKILGTGEKPLFILPFGKKEIKSVFPDSASPEPTERLARAICFTQYVVYNFAVGGIYFIPIVLYIHTCNFCAVGVPQSLTNSVFRYIQVGGIRSPGITCPVQR